MQPADAPGMGIMSRAASGPATSSFRTAMKLHQWANRARRGEIMRSLKENQKKKKQLRTKIGDSGAADASRPSLQRHRSSTMRLSGEDSEALLQRVRGWNEQSLREAGGCSIVTLPVPVAVATEPRHTKIRHDPITGRYCLDLVCHETQCAAVMSTDWCRWDEECYAQAKARGWFKPPSQSWGHSRCPCCKW